MMAESKRPGTPLAVLKDKGCTDNYDSPIMAFFEGIVPFITTHLKKSRRGRHI